MRTALSELVGTEEMDEVPGVLAEDDAEEGKVTEVTAVLEETVEVVGVEVIAILEKLREFSSE